MASLSDVSRYLRQRRAIGKPITNLDRQAAWNSYFDTEANKTLERSKLAISRKNADTSAKSVANTLAINKERLAISKEAQASADQAAMVSGITNLGELAYMGRNTAVGKAITSKASDLYTGAKSLVTGAQSGVADAVPAISSSPPIGAGTAGGNAGLALASTTEAAAPTVTMGVSGAAIPASDAAALSATGSSASGAVAGSTGAIGALGTAGLAYGAGKIADKLIGDKVHEAGSIATGAVAGAALGGPPGAIIGGIIGFAVDKISNATWLCTKTKGTIGMTKEEWSSIGKFRQYAKENHKDWLEVYIKIGPDLLNKINGDNEFYNKLKEEFIIPIIKLTDGGFYDAAYRAYKSTVVQLVRDYAPELMPEGI